MARKVPAPKITESRFNVEELFFSTTDNKGVILNGNDVFVRVSKYALNDLIGRPHNIIRHPDMPRVAFWLLWDYLLAGKSVAAFVKNMAADGSFYWVLAVVAPIKEGYLSIRLKPSSGLKEKFEALYLQLLAIEKKAPAPGNERRDALEESKAALFGAVASLGYPSYDELMHDILVAEVRSRRQLMARAGHSVRPQRLASLGEPGGFDRLNDACDALTIYVEDLFGRLEAFLALDKELSGKIDFIRSLGSDLHRVALNAQVQAEGLQLEGATLQVIAEQMNCSSRGVADSAGEICGIMGQVTRSLKRAAAQIAMSDLSVEMMARFLRESHGVAGSDSERDIRHRISQLAEVVAGNLHTTFDLMKTAGHNIDQLEQRLESFLKEIRTLEILRISGKVEAVHCQKATSVSAIFEDVFSRTREAREKLTFLVELAAQARFRDVSDGAFQIPLRTLQAA